MIDKRHFCNGCSTLLRSEEVQRDYLKGTLSFRLVCELCGSTDLEECCACDKCGERPTLKGYDECAVCVEVPSSLLAA